VSDKHAQETQIRYQLIIYDVVEAILHAILQQRAQIKKESRPKAVPKKHFHRAPRQAPFSLLCILMRFSILYITK
jgi:translation initiation factor IF-2